MYVLALSDYKQPAAAAGYKPAPQLGRQIAVYISPTDLNVSLKKICNSVKIINFAVRIN